MVLRHVGLSLCLAVSLIACNGGGRPSSQDRSDFCRYARYFDVIGGGDSVAAVTFSPFDGSSDTLMLRKKAERIVCMSSSYVACLSAIGCESTVVAVSGAGYISDPMIRQRWLRTAAGDPSDLPLYDIGYESTLDVERIVALRPDIVAVYTVSAAESKYVRRMKDLGLPVIVLYDHYEHEPLARAEYMRLFGALTGHEAEADSLFSAVETRYLAIRDSVGRIASQRKKVLLNVPYGDVWYIPGGENYMSRLIEDAGGVVLGAAPESPESTPFTVEKALSLASAADFWLNTGLCRSLGQLEDSHPGFRFVPPFSRMLSGQADVPCIFNNVRRTTPEGGNDFWESGAVRPDLILEDLAAILQQEGGEADSLSLHYYIELEQTVAAEGTAYPDHGL